MGRTVGRVGQRAYPTGVELDRLESCLGETFP